MQSTQSSGQQKSQQLKIYPWGKVQSLEIIYLETPNIKSENLFDYNEQYPTAKRLQLKDSAVLAVTKDNKFCLLKEQLLKDQKVKKFLDKIKIIFCSFTHCENYYLLKSIKNSLSKSVWLDVGSLKHKLFPLRKNYIIRLGQKVFRIKKLVTHDQQLLSNFTKQSQELLKQFLDNNNQLEFPKPKSLQNQQIYCKICKGKGQIKNPLILPCQCNSNLSYVHLSCLQNLFKQNYPIQTNLYSLSLRYSPIKCSMCHSKLKNYFHFHEKTINMFSFPHPKPPYLILMHQKIEKQQKKQSYLQIISFQKYKSLCLGNSPKSHIYFQNQNTIESVHCQIIYHNQTKKFLLIDLDSRFGTLIKVKQSLKIRPHNQNLRVQIGNVALDFNVSRMQVIQKIKNFDKSNSLFERTEKNDIENQDFSLFI